MSRRMMSPQALIKSQIVDDKYIVDLNEILEKYGTITEDSDKCVTLQFYSKDTSDDGQLSILTGTDIKGYVALNTAITISKYSWGDVFIGGLFFNTSFTNFIGYISINNGDYESGILLQSTYKFDVHVIRV